MSSGNSPAEGLPEDLKAVEKALRRLTPAASQIDRDRLMYLAGQASVTSAPAPSGSIIGTRFAASARRNWWPVATAALAMISITLGGLLADAIGRGQTVVYLQLPRADVGDQAHANWSSDQISNAGFSKSTADNVADYF